MDPAIQKNYAQGYPGGNNNALRSDPTMAAMAVALDAVPVDSHQPWNFSVPATAVPHASAPPPSQQSINVEATKEFLTANGWAKGLQDTFISNLSKIPIRFIICDDSGSMSTNDGHKIVDLGRGNKK